MYTDGLSEAENPEGNMYGDERVKQFLIQNRDLNPKQLVENFWRDAEFFMSDTPRTDDLTMLTARVE
jgi:sigma-B regulation protein RsbU (phosphoserine phosphatase)